MRSRRVISAAAAVLLVLINIMVPIHTSAQEAPGHISLTVRICTVATGPRLAATFSDVPCDIPGGSGYDRFMVISLDNGAFVDGTSSLELPLAPILNGNLYAAPGDYTLTIAFDDNQGPVETSVNIQIVSGETLPLTYTVTYAYGLGAQPPLPPVVTVPEIPVDQAATPAPSIEVPDTTAPVAIVPDVTGRTGESDTTIPETPATDAGVIALPNTGTGQISAPSVLLVAILALGAMTGAAAIRLRRV